MLYDSFMQMKYVELYRVWYSEIFDESISEENPLRSADKCVGETENLDRAEAVEMFLWENGFQKVRIETLRVYENGDMGNSVFSSMRRD